MMKIGIMSSAYVKIYGLEKGLRLLREQGYECIDYQDFANTDLPMFQLPDRDFEAFLLKQKKLIEGMGLEISQTHGPWRWPIQDSTEEDRAERFEKMSRAIRGTAVLGCRNFVIHPIMPYGFDRDPEPEKVHEINLEFMGRLTRVAEKENVVICFENMPMTALRIAPPQACLAFAREISSPNFRICLDTGHCTMLGVKPADAVRMLGKEMLQVLHVHDNDGVFDSHWVPFTGKIDWEDFRRALQEIGFEGCVSLETACPAKFTGENRRLQERSLFLSAQWIASRDEPPALLDRSDRSDRSDKNE